MSRRTGTGYMCKTEFDYELSCASDGVKVYPSEKSARRYCPCIHQCGLVEVTVSLVRVVQDENWESPNKRAASAIEARSDATPKSGAAEGESAGDAQ